MSHLTELSDDDLRRAHRLKWSVAPEGVIPAWVAESDFAVAEPIRDALAEAVASSAIGYPGAVDGVVEAFVGFQQRRFGWAVDPRHVTQVPTVLGALETLLTQVAEPGGVIVPIPAYPPFLEIPGLADRPLVTVSMAHDDAWRLPLDAIREALSAGARTLIITNPHNPLGRVWTADELRAVADLAAETGALVISDEIHAPLSLPGHTFTPYLAVAGADAHAATITSSTKTFNCPGVGSAQIVASDAITERLAAIHPLRQGFVWTLGSVAARAAYRDCDGWLDEFRARIAENMQIFADEMSRALPQVRVPQPEATYLQWLDLAPYADGSAAAHVRERCQVMVNDGRAFGDAADTHVRVNLATGPDRVRELARRLGRLAAN